MASRYGASNSNLHQRDARSALFGNYDGGGGGGGASNGGQSSSAPRNGYGGGGGGGYGYSSPGGNGNGSLGVGYGGGALGLQEKPGFRPATPNKRGQYSDAVLNELESQNDEHVEGILGKVKMLKGMTIAIGEEIRESSALAEKMNDSFDQTRVRLRGTMNRMLLMAERTGVGWKVWLMFFAAVTGLFMWVWVF